MMDVILCIDPVRTPRCSCCKGFDGLGRPDTDGDTGEFWWWCRSCDPALRPPPEIPGQMDLGFSDAGMAEASP